MSLNRQKLTERILATVENMPEPMRCVFVLTHYRGFEPEQVESRVGLGADQVLTLIRQAQRHLYDGVGHLAPDFTAHYSGQWGSMIEERADRLAAGGPCDE